MKAPSLHTILLLAFACRGLWALLVPLQPVSDAAIYDVFAVRLSEGLGYSWPDGSPTVYWPVGTSALYGAFYAFFGRSLASASILNVVLGVVLVASVYLLARTRFSRGTSRWAALIVAVWPNWLAFTTVLSSELPSTILVTIGSAAVIGSRSRAPQVLIGCVCLVLAGYFRPTSLVLSLVVPILAGAWSGGWRHALRNGLIALLVAGAVLAPWMARNQAEFGKPILVSANFGANLWMGNNPQSDGGYMPLPEGLPKDEAARDGLLLDRALAFIAKDPVRYFELCVSRIVTTFSRETIGVWWNERSLPDATQPALKLTMTIYWLIVFTLSLLGSVVYLRQSFRNVTDPIFVSAAALASSALLVVGMDRYHMPLTPYIAMFAALAISRIARSRATGTPSTSGASQVSADGPV